MNNEFNKIIYILVAIDISLDSNYILSFQFLTAKNWNLDI